jgi:2-oxoglutarate ferredoxin oxidoreductase subunit alpha
MHRGKVLSAEDLQRLGGFARYKDVDGDGIGYRTLPGTNHPAAAYFARGSGHNEKAQYSEREDDYVNNMDRLSRKFETMRDHVPTPEIVPAPGAKIGIVCCGTSRYACEESRDQLAAEYGVAASYLRLKAYPFTKEVDEFIDAHERVYIVEQNRDAQLLALMRMDFEVHRIAKLRSVRHYSGLPIDARSVTVDIANQEGI